MQKTAAVLVVALLAGYACAQGQAEDSVDATSMLETAVAQLATTPYVYGHLTGTQTQGAVTQALQADIFWSAEPSHECAELDLYRDGVETNVVIADGVGIYSLDVARNEYKVAYYGSYKPTQPDGYRDALLRSVVAFSPSLETLPTSLLLDAFREAGPQYHTWFPGQAPTVVGYDVTYSVGAPVTRQATYHLNSGTGGISSIDYYDAVPVGPDWRVLNWTMTLDGYASKPAGWSFAFVPPANSRAIDAKAG